MTMRAERRCHTAGERPQPGPPASSPRASGRRASFPIAAASPCRFCGAPLFERVADLGLTPLPGPLRPPGAVAEAERFFPLRAMVCSDCRLVQLAETEAPHAVPPEEAAERVGSARAQERQGWATRMARTLRLGPQTPVAEVAGRDGLLLPALRRSGLPVLAVDPATPAAAAAGEAEGIPTEARSFGAMASRRLRATSPAPALILANDLLAQAPDLHDAVEGVRTLLAPGGVAAFETRHLLRLMEDGALGAIRHGRVSYFSLLVAELVLGQHGLVVFDAEELPAEGGTLRLLARHVEDIAKPVGPAVERLRAEERRAGLEAPEPYASFARGVVETKCALLDFLVGARRGGRRVAAYGASAEGVTLLNYCGAGPELLAYAVDPDPGRQGMLLPGVRLPVRLPEALLADRPDYLLVLPWWQAEAVMEEMAALRDAGTRFVLATPRLRVV